MHRNQTWHAGSPERWKMFLYNYVQNPISRKGKILPKKNPFSKAMGLRWSCSDALESDLARGILWMMNDASA
jgi:hypothetical protein